VKQLAELHGGTVAVASAEGQGARFAVWLPMRKPYQAVTPRRPSVPGDAGAASVIVPAVEAEKRVALVIDDDDHAADLLRLFLEAEGFAVLRAVSAEDALLMAPRQTLALITLDIQLYGMNGWQFLLQLRERGSPHAPVVIISGRPVGNLAQARGAAAVLLKPVSRGELKATLAELGLLVPARNTPAQLIA